MSESGLGGTVCEKDARTGLWGRGEVTNRSTWKSRRRIKIIQSN